MIDDSDGDWFAWASFGTTGWLGIVLFVCAVVLWIIAAQNETECQQRACEPEQTAKLFDHECVCVGAPARKVTQ